MVRKLVELPKFLVFNSKTNSFGNSSVFAFYLLLFALYRFLYLLFKLLIMGFVTFFYVCVSDEAERLPPLRPHQRWDVVFHGPALPGVLESAIQRTHPSWLRRGRSGLTLPTVHGLWHGLVRGQRDDTLQPHRAVVRVHHRQ
jgi:hypothetical protein